MASETANIPVFPRFQKMAGKMASGYVIRRTLERILPVLEREVKRQLSLGGSYRRRKGEKYEPNPGKHLRRGSSDLFNSWTARGIKRTGNEQVGVIASTESYAAVHEYGHKHIPKRPYVKPAIKEKRQKCIDIYRSEVRAAFSGVGI